MASHGSPDSDEIKKVLLELSRALSNAQSEAAEMLTKVLDEVSTPRLTMSLLSQSIFCTTGEEAMIPMDLEVVAYLVTYNPDKYLKETSRAVRNAAELSSVMNTSRPPVFTVEKSSKIVQVISSQIFSEDVEVSDNASKAMAAICRQFDAAVNPSVEAIMHCWSLTSSPVVAIRCASTLIEIVVFHERAMNLAVSLGAMDKVLELMTNDKDPLTQMVVIDLIETIATAKPIHVSCARWISTNQVLLPLLEMSGGTDEINPLLGGPALRVLSLIFSNVISKHLVSENLDSNHFQGFKRALHNFDSSGESGRLAFIDAVSSLASASDDALTGVLDDPFLRNKWLSLKNVAQPKLKSAVLGSIARVIDPDSVEGSDSKQVESAYLSPSNALSLRLFNLFGSINAQDPTDMLISLARSPIVETRLGSYVLLQAITKRDTILKTLLSNKDFFDFLIDRAVERTKEGKEAKHIIVKNVLNGQLHTMISEEAVKKLQDIAEQGPFFVQTLSWEMATE